MPMVSVVGCQPHHPVPVACVLTCSWLLLLFHAASGLKPAKLPLVDRKPFVAVWNAPLDLCTVKYQVHANVERLFHISGSPRAVHTGQNVTIFYANRLGLYPFYTDHGVPVNGGLPQNGSLDTHLRKAENDIARYIPAKDFAGLAVIDWEFWRPQWDRNWHKKEIYRRKSSELIAKDDVNVTGSQIEELARRRFERSAVAFMQNTVELGTRLRPKGLWGFYLYPDCHNYNQHEPNYTGSCPAQESRRNNELLWLWNSSTALFPSVAIKKSHKDSASNRRFSQFRVLESLRVAGLTSHDYELPTYVYTRLGYKDEAMTFLTTQDLIQTIGESAAVGAAGFVIWGDLNLTSSKHNCTIVKSFLYHRLGQYITNVTRAAEVCSDFLCQSNGRCVRRNLHAPHYLHLSGDTYKIKPSGDGSFVVSGRPSESELELLVKRFRCHCYEGHAGTNCDRLNKVEPETEEGDVEREEEDRCASAAESTRNNLRLVVVLPLLNFFVRTVI
ncbi:hypothetical protein DPEC_G00214650 [Dallia pectoralis]|uniref:Uncharacterized protein n=1 Tax=Dallia pectoralis TaxID=75939 RepID=A0ACC2G2C5_DALPE|nr:hypothetical protein DPEC_G00214650 [Dallia pectoralis]